MKRRIADRLAAVLTKGKRVARRFWPKRTLPPSASSIGTDPFVAPIPPLVPTDPAGPTIVLLNDCRDQVNYGANALVDGLLTIIRGSAPDATILPIPSHWLIDAAHGLGAYVNNGAGFSQPKAKYPVVADQFDAVADEWMDGRATRDEQEFTTRIKGADLVVLNGEGSLYRNNVSAVRELFLAWLAKERFGIPTVYLNGGLHLTDVMPVLPAMVRKTFATLDAVAVREPRSLRNLHAFVPGVDARLYPDSAFVFAPEDAHESAAVTAIRDQIGGAAYFCFDPGTMPIDARRGGASALHKLISSLKRDARQAVFVCSAPADRYVEGIAHETGSLYVDTITDYREFMALVSDAQFLVSGRYHNVILAAIMGCPSIALGSANHKVHGACEMLDDLVGSPYDGTSLLPDLDAIVERAQTYVQDRAMWNAKLREACTRRRVEVGSLGTLVSDTLRSRT